jgi:hypothetical protein
MMNVHCVNTQSQEMVISHVPVLRTIQLLATPLVFMPALRGSK